MMKFVLLTSILSILTTTAYSKEEKYITARITYYCGDDRWGSQVACPKTKTAKEGITIAAHPDFKFGKQVYIPMLKNIVGDGKFVVQDRGSWVTKKKASKGKAYVFDVYVKSCAKLKKLAKNQPMYMKVLLVDQ